MDKNTKKKPPKLKRPISPITLMKYGLGILFFVWLLYPSEDSISDITENRVPTYRFMMHREHINLRLSANSFSLRSILNPEEQNNISVLYDIDSSWSVSRTANGHILVSPQRSMYCRVSTQPVKSLTGEGLVGLEVGDFKGKLSLIEQSVKRGIRQMLSSSMVKTSFSKQMNITPDTGVEIIFVTAFAIYRAEGLYEYSYHRIQVEENGVFHHYCVSPFFNKTTHFVKLLSSIKLSK